jgi:hypothetical protein
MKYTKEQVERSGAYLLDTLKIKPGDTVYTIVRHVSRSGMSRNIEAYVMRDNEPVNISTSAATLLESPIAKDGGVKMGGCGMDMGFALVYGLSYTLFPGGFTCTGEGCPSNDHSNGDKDRSPHHHDEGGYALKQRWM